MYDLILSTDDVKSTKYASHYILLQTKAEDSVDETNLYYSNKA